MYVHTISPFESNIYSILLFQIDKIIYNNIRNGEENWPIHQMKTGKENGENDPTVFINITWLKSDQVKYATLLNHPFCSRFFIDYDIILLWYIWSVPLFQEFCHQDLLALELLEVVEGEGHSLDSLDSLDKQWIIDNNKGIDESNDEYNDCVQTDHHWMKHFIRRWLHLHPLTNSSIWKNPLWLHMKYTCQRPGNSLDELGVPMNPYLNPSHASEDSFWLISGVDFFNGCIRKQMQM